MMIMLHFSLSLNFPNKQCKCIYHYYNYIMYYYNYNLGL